MHKMTSKFAAKATAVAVAAAIWFAAGEARADTFNLSPVTIDTHSLSGTSGYLLFAFDPSTEGTTPVTSTVSISGTGLTGFSLNNSGASNYQLAPYTFGNTFTFTTSFVTSPTTGADSGNVFSLYVLDNSYTPIPTEDPTGSDAAAMVVQYANGTVSSTTVYAPFKAVGPVPEAPTLTATVAIAAASVLTFALRRKAAA